MSSGRHGSMDGRGWTDIFTNATGIAPRPEEDDPRPWLGVPESAPHVSTFLHEATHHWCFHSPVGNVLLGLIARAEANATLLLITRDRPRRAAKATEALDLLGQFFEAVFGPTSTFPDPRSLLEASRSPQLRPHLGWRDLKLAEIVERRDELVEAVAEDLVRVETAISLLRPLAEGLAQFAQYDAVSRVGSSAWSPLQPALAMHFYGMRNLAALKVPQPYATMVAAANVLSRLRCSADVVDSKADLLLSPFAAAAGGYLPGYLTVKSMWRHACRRDGRLRYETDLFLMYLRSYVYDDWGLVEELLAPRRSARRSAERIANHLKRRLDVFESLTGDDVADFERHVVDSSGSAPGHVPGILVDRAASARGRASAQQLFREVTELLSTADQPWGSGQAERISRMNRRRPYLCVTSVPVMVDVDLGAEVRWGGEAVLTVSGEDLLPGAVSGRYEDARLEVLVGLDSDRFIRAAFVSRGRPGEPTTLISCTAWGPPDRMSELRAEMVASYLDRDSLMSDSTTMRWLVDETIGDDVVQFEVAHIRDQLDDLADQLYRDTALWFARDTAAIDACAEAMAQDGLGAVLGNSRLVRGLALLGLATNMNPERAAVEGLFRNAGLDLDETLVLLQKCWEQHGYPPRVREYEGGLFCVI